MKALARVFCVLLLASIVIPAVPQASAAESPPKSGWWETLGAHDFGGARLTPSGRWYVVVFLSTECPLANASVPGLNALASEFVPRGFAFIGAYVDPTTDAASFRKYAADYPLCFAAADDRSHRLVRAGGAEYTPEAVVFSGRGAVLYRGRIDDRVGALGAARPAATREDLREVLLALASGKPGPFDERPGYGCSIPESPGR